MTTRCLIFDSDGTLVDSELLNCEAMSAELQDSGITEDASDLVVRYRGWMLKSLLQDLQQRHEKSLDEEFTPRFRHRAAKHLEKMLTPVDHIPEVLSLLDQPMCVASNAPLDKLELSLRVSGLASFFGNHVYSAYEIGSWKPDPDLFLHAAKKMGFDPSQCVVIEDSIVGVSAAVAAGIDVVLYNPGRLQVSPDQHVRVIDSMAQLPSALNEPW